jgi:hypothetical protein
MLSIVLGHCKEVPNSDGKVFSMLDTQIGHDLKAFRPFVTLHTGFLTTRQNVNQHTKTAEVIVYRTQFGEDLPEGFTTIQALDEAFGVAWRKLVADQPELANARDEWEAYAVDVLEGIFSPKKLSAADKKKQEAAEKAEKAAAEKAEKAAAERAEAEAAKTQA